MSIADNSRKVPEERGVVVSERLAGVDKVRRAVTGTELHVCKDIAERQQAGINKYGQTVTQNPMELRGWLQHLYEELLDGAIYAKRAMEAIDCGAAGFDVQAMTINTVTSIENARIVIAEVHGPIELKPGDIVNVKIAGNAHDNDDGTGI